MSMIKYNNEYRKLITVYYNNGTNIIQVSEIKNNNNTVFSKALENVSYTVTYYNYDGTIADTETVASGENATGNVSIITKPDSTQYTYSFIGWSTTENDTTVDANALANIVADKSLYPVYSETLRTFTVYFYSQDGLTLLGTETVNNGQNAQGLIQSPTKASDTNYNYNFMGWNSQGNKTSAEANILNSITQNKTVYAAFEPAYKSDTISDSWEDIIESCSDGTYSSKYNVGDLKTVDLGTEGIVQMQIVGINVDDKADDSGKAPITWISKQLLNTSRRMNPAYSAGTSGTGALGGWEACEMRSYLINTIKPLLPSEVRNALKMVKKYSKIYNTSETAVNNVVSNDDIWIPSAYEVNFTGYETSGATYSTAFPDNASRIKHQVGGSAAWWLRSAPYTGGFRVVNSGGVGTTAGANTSYGANGSGGVTLGFCT